MPSGIHGCARLVSGNRSWHWSPPGEAGWPEERWVDECLETDSARWWARLAISRPTSCPPLVFVHGVVVSGLYFQPVAVLLDNDFHLYVPDLPGIGRSETGGTVWSIPELANGLAEWMDLHTLQHAVLISNSLGGQVVTQLASQRPDLAGALILVGPTGDPDARSWIRLLWRGVRTLPKEDRGLWPVWIRDLVRSGPIRSIRHMHKALHDPQHERLDEIGVPGLVVGGERDPIAPPEWIGTMAGSLPNGRKFHMPGAPHALNFSNPDELAQVIRLVAGGVLDTPG